VRKILFFILILSCILSAQDSTKSLAIKPTTIYFYKPLVQHKNAGYPLLAAYLLIQKAKDGDVFSQHELGIRYLLHEGFPADTVQAAYWIKKAADQNLPSAKMNYAIMVNNGMGVEWNPFEAYKHFKYAAYHDVPNAQFAYGIFLIDNMVVNRNLTEAYVWIRKASNKGIEGADEVLKKLEEKGIHAPESLTTEIESKINSSQINANDDVLISQDFYLDYFEFTSDSSGGKSEKMFEDIQKLTTSQIKELLGINKYEGDDTTNVSLIRRAANNGSPEALYILGRAYETGSMVGKNTVLAMINYIRAYRLGSTNSFQKILELTKDRKIYELLKKEIDSGNGDAMFAWAGLAALGFNSQLAADQALELLIKAGEQGNIYALVEAGLCYHTGTLVKEDKSKALGYWGRAIQLGSKEALVRMAFSNIFSDNDFAVQNSNFNVLLQAANEGSVLAQTYIAYCYEKGKGTPVNKALAVRYYRNASQRGNETAYESLIRMHDEIRPDEAEYKIY